MRPIILDSEANATRLWSILKGWKDALQNGEPISVEVKPYRDKRSLAALRFYWGVVLKDISEQIEVNGRRYSPETWHEQMKRDHNGCVDLPNGQVIGLTTTDMNDSEFALYTTRCQAWAMTEHGVIFSEEAA